MPLPDWVGKLAIGRASPRVGEGRYIREDPDALAEQAREYPLPDDLRPMDALAARWAQQAFEWQQSNANPIYWAMREAEGAALRGGTAPTMDEDVLAFDQCVRRCHAAVYAFFYVWYCTGGSVDQKARRIGMPGRSAMYKRRDIYLSEIRGQLKAGFRIVI